MVDFAKLSDPVWREARRKEREEEERQQQSKQTEIHGLVEKCLQGLDSLSEKERSLVRSCRARLITYLPLSAPQEKWLRDIARRLPGDSD